MLLGYGPLSPGLTGVQETLEQTWQKINEDFLDQNFR